MALVQSLPNNQSSIYPPLLSLISVICLNVHVMYSLQLTQLVEVKYHLITLICCFSTNAIMARYPNYFQVDLLKISMIHNHFSFKPIHFILEYKIICYLSKAIKMIVS